MISSAVSQSVCNVHVAATYIRSHYTHPTHLPVERKGFEYLSLVLVLAWSWWPWCPGGPGGLLWSPLLQPLPKPFLVIRQDSIIKPFTPIVQVLNSYELARLTLPKPSACAMHRGPHPKINLPSLPLPPPPRWHPTFSAYVPQDP